MPAEQKWSFWLKLAVALFLLFLVGGYLYFVVQWPWGGTNEGVAEPAGAAIGRSGSSPRR